MSRRTHLARMAALTLVVAACDDPILRRIDPLAPKMCPDDQGSGPMLNGKYLSDSTKSQYYNIIIDGQLVARNLNGSRNERFVIPGFPRQDEVKRVWAASWYMSPDSAARRFHTCLNGSVWIYETKEGNWRPPTPLPRRPGLPTEPTP